jgi:hypothetical protein
MIIISDSPAFSASAIGMSSRRKLVQTTGSSSPSLRATAVSFHSRSSLFFLVKLCWNSLQSSLFLGVLLTCSMPVTLSAARLTAMDAEISAAPPPYTIRLSCTMSTETRGARSRHCNPALRSYKVRLVTPPYTMRLVLHHEHRDKEASCHITPSLCGLKKY